MFDINQLETPLSDAEFKTLQEFFQSQVESYLRNHRNSASITLKLPLEIDKSLRDQADFLGSTLAYPVRAVIAVSLPRLRMAAKLIRRCRYQHRVRAEVDPIDSNDIEHQMAWLFARWLETAAKGKRQSSRGKPYPLFVTPSTKENLRHAMVNHGTDLNSLIVELLRLVLLKGDSGSTRHG